MECADLTPSVGKQLVAAHRAANHLIDVFRGLILAVDFLVFLVGELRGYEARVPGDRTKLVGSGMDDGASLVADNRGAEGMGEHDHLLLRRMANCYAGSSSLKISRDILRGFT